MPFMEQQVTRKLLWLQIDGNHGITFVDAADVADSGLKVDESTDDEDVLEQYEDYYDGTDIQSVGLIEGFGARLSAPGYMDCTDWSVFDAAKEAQEFLDENYPEDEDEEE
jgi:hypothetical protein